MDFTFGIITYGGAEHNLNQIISSIHRQSIPNYEIIIIGDAYPESSLNLTIRPFNEFERPAWITRKKNLVVQHAKYENVVLMHDYVCLEDGWYGGWKRFGNDFQVASNIQLNPDKTRGTDHQLSIWCVNHLVPYIETTRKVLLPYDVTDLSRFMYISGIYWVAKKSVMMEFKLDEKLSWGQGEDLEWSKRVREKYPFKFNPYSTVNYLKQKGNPYQEIEGETLRILRNRR